MVEGIPTEEEINRIERSTKGMASLAEGTARVTQFLNSNAESADRTTRALGGTGRAANQVTDAMSSLIKELGGFEFFVDLIDQATEKFKDFGNTGFTALGFMGLIPQASDLFGNLGKSGSQAGANITDSFGRLSPLLELLPDQISNFVKKGENVTNFANQAQQMELSLIGAAAASGQLNDVQKRLGSNLEDLANLSATYNEKIFQTAVATGVLPSRIQEFADQLRQIPDLLDTNIKATEESAQSMSSMEAALKIASAFQRDHQEVVDQVAFAYRNFGETGRDAIDFIARMNSVAQDLVLPMDLMHDFVMQNSESMKLFGNNTDAAIAVMSRFGSVLKDQGLGPAAVNEVVSGMMQGIKGLDVAQKAFISGATGGPGGLAGAFQIDKLLREGRMDEVLDKTMDAMQKQFGGQVLTVEDVERTPALAGEFQKQISFIKDVAGLAGSDIEAQRVLEAMKTGRTEPLEDFKTRGQDDLKNAVEFGTKVQERNMNELLRHAQELERQQQTTAEASWATVRALGGKGLALRAETAGERAGQLAGFGKIRVGDKRVPGEGPAPAEMLTATQRREEAVDRFSEQLKRLPKIIERFKEEGSIVFEEFSNEINSELQGRTQEQLSALADKMGIKGIANFNAGELKGAIQEKISGFFGGTDEIVRNEATAGAPLSLLKAMGLGGAGTPKIAPITAPTTPAETMGTAIDVFGPVREKARAETGARKAMEEITGNLNINVTLQTDKLEEIAKKQVDIKWEEIKAAQVTGRGE